MKNNINRRLLFFFIWTLVLALAGGIVGLNQSLNLSKMEEKLSSAEAQVQMVVLKNRTLESLLSASQKSNQDLSKDNKELSVRNYKLSARSSRLSDRVTKLEKQSAYDTKQVVNLNAEVQKLLSELSSHEKSLEEPEVKATKTSISKQVTPSKSKSNEGKAVKILYPTATAYGASVRNGGAGTGRTYTGVAPVEGRTIAADPKVLPMGTRVRIECATYPSVNGVYVVEDIGGAINGSRIDIYMDDSKRSTMLDFGRRQVTLTVLSK